MLSKWFCPVNPIKVSSAFAVFFMIALLNFSCKYDRRPKEIEGDPLKNAIQGMDTATHDWATWNVLFKPGTDASARSTYILSLENYLNSAFLNKFPWNYSIHFQVYYCPCDSLLYNLGVKVLNGSGDVVISPPPPPPPGGSGDALFVSNNNTILETDTLSVTDTTHTLKLVDGLQPTQIDSTILAIIDTGLDPAYFTPEIHSLIWSGQGTNTIYNVIGPNIHSFMDDHIGRHGTVVAAVALKALKDQNADVRRSAADTLGSLRQKS